MKLESILCTPSAYINFTQSELAILMWHSAHHYDHTCKAAGEIGGFLFGIRNQLLFNSDASVRVDSTQLNLMMKIVETPGPQFERLEVGTLSRDLYHVFVNLQDEYRRLNN